MFYYINFSLLVIVVTVEQREAVAQQNAPTFVVSFHDADLIEGTSVRFMIKVKGEPMPDVEL